MGITTVISTDAVRGVVRGRAAARARRGLANA
jgi:hypothetical protein